MRYSKPLTTLALALALPAAALANPAGASAGEVPARHQASDTLAAPGGDRAGTTIGTLSPLRPGSPAPDLAGRPRVTPGGGPRWPSASDSISPGPWCVYQCITSGVAYRHGDGVRLVLETSSPADMVLIVCRDDNDDYDCDYHAAKWSDPGQTEFEWVIEPLDPGTYWVTAAATDATGTSHAFGQFTLS